MTTKKLISVEVTFFGTPCIAFTIMIELLIVAIAFPSICNKSEEKKSAYNTLTVIPLDLNDC